MVEVIRWTFLVTIIGLAVVIGCTLVAPAEDLVFLSIDSPSDNETVYITPIIVSGSATAMGWQVVKSVMVKGDPASGTTFWSSEISLEVGSNTITAIATTDTNNTDTETITVIYIRPPVAPQNLQLTAGGGYVNLGWSAPSDIGGSALTEYKIYSGTSSGGGRYLTSVSPPTTYYNDTEVINNQEYYYQVSAVNSAGEGEKSNKVYATPTPKPTSTPISTPTPTLPSTLPPKPTPIATPKPTPTLPSTPKPTPTPTPPPEIGDIAISTNIESASFTIYGPATFSGSGISWHKGDAPAGTYRIAYGAVSGYDTPLTEPKILYPGELITFTGEYEPVWPLHIKVVAIGVFATVIICLIGIYRLLRNR